MEKPKREPKIKSIEGGGGFFIKPRNQTHENTRTRLQKPQSKVGTSSSEKSATNQKKPFDKKKYRMKKYSNKYKVEKWEDERKKKVLHRYYKDIKHEKPGVDVQKIYAEAGDDSGEDTNREESLRQFHNKVDKSEDNSGGNETKERLKKPRLKAHEKFIQLKQEKLKKKEEILQRKAEKEEAIKKYKQKKSERYKKLSKKTKKGQPVMKDRLEMLLEKIQSSCQQDS